MNLANERWRKRIVIAAAQMIVMRANDDVLVRLSRQISEHIIYGGAGALNIDLQQNLQIRGKSQRGRIRGSVDFILNVGQRLPRGRKPLLRGGIFHLQEKYPGILGAADASESRERILFTIAQYSVDDNDGFCAVIPGIDRFGDQLRVLCQAVVPAFGRKARRLVTKHNYNLVLHIEMRVIVITKFFRSGSISGEYNGAADFARRRKAERNEVLIYFKGLLCSAVYNLKAIVILQFRAGDDAERLQIGVFPRGLQSQSAKALFDQVCRERQSRASVTTALHRGSCERLNVVQISLRIRGISCCDGACGEKTKGQKRAAVAPTGKSGIQTSLFRIQSTEFISTHKS